MSVTIVHFIENLLNIKGSMKPVLPLRYSFSPQRSCQHSQNYFGRLRAATTTTITTFVNYSRQAH